MSAHEYPCPCCGYLMFDEPPGSYAICKICFWEDDAVQLAAPSYRGGANGPSLLEAQLNFLRDGACEEGIGAHVRKPTADDARDAEFRLLDPARDYVGTEIAMTLDEEPYYWRRSRPIDRD